MHKNGHNATRNLKTVSQTLLIKARSSFNRPKCIVGCNSNNEAEAGTPAWLSAMLQDAKISVDDFKKDLTSTASKVSHLLTPKSAGDPADWMMMILSTIVFTVFAMHLYRIYAFLAYPQLFN
ncbi:hypothetical protein CEUSTIGMA_g5977.t1 [Chlamydomonas eustigma]|uniref:Uncharacterized protein n=1 Tax=Chlamydomonas eustigma TaxID=1157962 RepID=A0A250X624_9CHLO|nr:hypothetical protein CEUSTIGMA_g5977.t1 [Chlamydomonas eustigma]|eukprot:GAX78537.1 hypothetical protein CEUSTIGMA_g5977.t1 [Chlamydomonas eustigma]